MKNKQNCDKINLVFAFVCNAVFVCVLDKTKTSLGSCYQTGWLKYIKKTSKVYKIG